MHDELLAINAFVADRLALLAGRDERIVVLNADVAKSVGVRGLADQLGSRFIQMGVSEQDMFLAAAGMATAGLVPIVTTFSVFASFRAAEQLRTFIAYPRLNVKVLVSHGGLSPAQDGVTHQTTEDLAVVRAIPNMTVIDPPDAYSAADLLEQAIYVNGPVYIRMNRGRFPVMIKDAKVGEAVLLRPGKDVALIATGSMVPRALQAASLADESHGLSVAVVAAHTIKPLDKDLIREVAVDCGAIVTCEEHNIIGGLGDAVSLALGDQVPVPVVRVGVRDEFAQSGTYEELVDYYGLGAKDILRSALRAHQLKKTWRSN